MVRRSRGLVLAVAIILRFVDSTALKPNMTAETDEILKNEGDPLEIVCSGTDKIYFVYPNMSGEIINTSLVEINEYREPNGTYRSVFRRPVTVYGDTGWYGCADHPIESTADPYLDDSATWVYVYVQSNTSLFVESDKFTSLHVLIGKIAVIPCRTTSPDLKVFLTRHDVMSDDLQTPFDPRMGFKLKDITLHDSDYYTCQTQRDGIISDINYHLRVYRNQTLLEPIITENNYVTQGQTLRMNCTMDVDADMPHILDWITPQESSRIITEYYSTVQSHNRQKSVLELVIRNVTAEDEGWYECSIKSFVGERKKRKYIEIHDPDKKFINLTTQSGNRHYQCKLGDKVQWVININAYPSPQRKWLFYGLNQKESEIREFSLEEGRYVVNNTPTTAILKIDHLNLSDMGTYSFQASHEDRIETLNFTLDVIVKPFCIVKTELYYMPNQLVKVLCNVSAFPEPNVTWSFIECLDYPLCKHSINGTLTHTEEKCDKASLHSTAELNITKSGRVICSACNTEGCDATMENIFVSDVAGVFDLISPKGPVIEGDNFELICAASVYNYSNIFEWRNEDKTPIVENNRLTIIQNETEFTYRSILRINDVQKKDSKTYTCEGSDMYNISQEERKYDLEVEDAQAPYFNNTNMGKDEMTIDINTHGLKMLNLKCYAIGMPKPNIIWYKDDIMLIANDQYKFTNDSQELHITYPLESDSGKYMCRAENRVGKVEAYQKITVKGKEIPKGLIVLIAILVIIVIILIIYFTIKDRREKIMRKELTEAGLMHFEEGAVECLNPDLTVDDQAELLPYDKKWEFPRERLKLGKQLGSGAFGVVMKAEAQGICEDEAVTVVAVKMVRHTTDPTYVRALASELKIMVHLGKHLNVVNLLGACTKNISKRELLVIVEYCRFGNLHNYLLRHRTDFINQIDPTTGKLDPNIGIDLLTRSASINSSNRIKYAALSFSRSLSANSGTESVHYQSTVDSQGVSMSPDGCILSNNSVQPGWRSNYRGDYKDQNLKPICTQDLLSWAFQVARGMEYLSGRKVLHGDLAARNILLAENNVVKICDFGLAKTMYKDDNYKKKGDGLLPIKWMAIESIRDRIFSTQSDIWSFGIVLWEFFTLAETPYPGMEAETLYQKLIKGYRMEKPEYATPEVYDIMLQCWKAKPTLRPSFTELVESIGSLLEDSVRAHYTSLNVPYMDMNTMMLEGGKNDYLTMLSAPDHVTLSSPTHEYANSPTSGNAGDSAYLCMSPSERGESGIFSPRSNQKQTHFEFPSPTSDSEDAAEISPMLKKEEDSDPYLKPINVQERRAEFSRMVQAMKNQAVTPPIDRDSGYCNTPQNLQLIELNEKNKQPEEGNDNKKIDITKEKNFVPSIIRTQDNYVNMPKQRIDLRKDVPDGFSNPSYVIMGNQEVK